MKLTDKSQRTVRLISSIVLSALLAVSAILLIVSCYSIYKSGPSPFTRDSISSEFSKISAVLYLTVIAAVLTAVIYLVIPPEKERLKGGRSKRGMLESLSSRVDFESLDEGTTAMIDKERRLRRILLYVNVAVIILEIILPLIYLLNPDNFPAVVGEYNAEILHGILVYTVFLLPLLIYEVLYVIITDGSLAREISLFKAAIGNGANLGDAKSEGSKSVISEFFRTNRKPIILGIRIAFIGCAIGFIAVGVLNGGADSVLDKAIKICTECIGLG